MSEKTILRETREQIAELGRLMYDRFLTDTAGGNISARIGDKICITSAKSGSNYRWRVTPEQVLVTDLVGNVIAGEGKVSRESKAHYKLYEKFSEGQAVVHCHARNVLVFATAGIPLEPYLEATLKFGATPVVGFAPAHSPELADNIANSMIGREAVISKQAALAIAPWHGLFSFGIDLNAAFDAAERMEVNAYVALQSHLLNTQLTERLSILTKSKEAFQN